MILSEHNIQNNYEPPLFFKWGRGLQYLLPPPYFSMYP